ncbi:MAG: hypothetical protein C4527_03945 [Candidatus Omnitrophota bacterium]|jgi:cytochrome b subunit of formate dehydrogenase|nr:MAG: hypothetical protein C4527_03945 [Candidatus Omnitrophota bacterium]
MKMLANKPFHFYLTGIFMLIGFCGSATSATNSEPKIPGVCPPFHLLDEEGNMIDPIKGINADKPYSPKQTCGKCHDYEKITRGFHFQQGADEKPTPEQSERVQWALTPGNYGGTWCSPAPLYRYLSPKQNESAVLMDMTSQTFITAGCGNCHPGGGPLEFDREGKRYDLWMKNPESGLVSGGENHLDGDYYKTNWDQTGVLEADCLLCHMPEYHFYIRNKQLKSTNFRWAATAAAGFAEVKGSIANGEPVELLYKKELFSPDGTISPHIVREPRNETCLQCHAQPGWKKRGANFRNRTDVHLRAGLRCVDCHPAGRSATDPRIHGYEEHQIGKGDDPGGQVRNDLDNTMVECLDCHDTGKMGAPIAVHRGLPPVHLERISCQACHIPERLVKPIQLQASDVLNAAPKISTPGKRLWTFYGPDGAFRNHYGYLEMMGYDDKPTESFRPLLAQYKGKIYPVNRVHSAWPGIETEDSEPLMQPRMSDIYKMWAEHQANPDAYPSLAMITDDNGDGIPEINRPEEIDALIVSVAQMLSKINYPMDSKRVVWVMNERVYRSGTDFRVMEKQEWEASPFANVHKYNHDIYPAKAALGANGCQDCHHPESPFFFASAFQYHFDKQAKPVLVSQSELMGYQGRPRDYDGIVGFIAGFFRWLTILVMAGLIIHIVLDFIARRRGDRTASEDSPDAEMIQRFNIHALTQHLLVMISVLILFVSAFSLWGLRYPGAPWAAALTALWGGVDFWRIIHRIGAILLLFTGLYHLIYCIVHAEGRRDFALMVPRKKDFTDFFENIRWFLGKQNQQPQFGRFTYFEKFDYWAVFWGCVIMGITGLGMWFPEVVKMIVPTADSIWFDSFKEAHAHEALLAFLAIVIWHVYNVHLRPGRFPGSLFWVHGRIPKKEKEWEHSLES